MQWSQKVNVWNKPGGKESFQPPIPSTTYLITMSEEGCNKSLAHNKLARGLLGVLVRFIFAFLLSYGVTDA